MRLDHYLVATDMFQSRHKAQIEIKAGSITVNGKIIVKPAYQLNSDDDVQAIDTFNPFVSKGGLKLKHALTVFSQPIKHLTVCDIGSSTGGFTDVLIKQGAAHVYAIDVGFNQMVEPLKNHAQVSLQEGMNFLHTRPTDFPQIDLAVMDVSFTSSIPHIVHAQTLFNCPIIVLVKPQFESLKTPKSGVIRDKKLHLEILRDYETTLKTHNIDITAWTNSPIAGGSGNIEFFALIKDTPHQQDLKALIDGAHQTISR